MIPHIEASPCHSGVGVHEVGAVTTDQPASCGFSAHRKIDSFATEMMCLAAEASPALKSLCTAALIRAGWPTTRLHMFLNRVGAAAE